MNRTFISTQFTHAMLLSMVAALGLASSSAGRAADTASEDPAALATQYTQQAAELRAKADKHAKLAKMHDAGSGSAKTAHASIAQHCEKIAANLRAAADESDALAATYSELAARQK